MTRAKYMTLLVFSVFLFSAFTVNKVSAHENTRSTRYDVVVKKDVSGHHAPYFAHKKHSKRKKSFGHAYKHKKGYKKKFGRARYSYGYGHFTRPKAYSRFRY